MYKNDWFEDRWAIQSPPQQAVIDCSRPGQPADEAVASWVKKRNFDGPSCFIREYLSGFGAWDAYQLCNHQDNLERLFWVWCCNLKEDPDYILYLSY